MGPGIIGGCWVLSGLVGLFMRKLPIFFADVGFCRVFRAWDTAFLAAVGFCRVFGWGMPLSSLLLYCISEPAAWRGARGAGERPGCRGSGLRAAPCGCADVSAFIFLLYSRNLTQTDR